MLDNLLFFLCEHTKDDVEKFLCGGTVAAARTGVERLTNLIVATAGTSAEISPAVLSRHCCSTTAVL